MKLLDMKRLPVKSGIDLNADSSGLQLDVKYSRHRDTLAVVKNVKLHSLFIIHGHSIWALDRYHFFRVHGA